MADGRRPDFSIVCVLKKDKTQKFGFIAGWEGEYGLMLKFDRQTDKARLHDIVDNPDNYYFNSYGKSAKNGASKQAKPQATELKSRALYIDDGEY